MENTPRGSVSRNERHGHPRRRRAVHPVDQPDPVEPVQVLQAADILRRNLRIALGPARQRGLDRRALLLREAVIDHADGFADEGDFLRVNRPPPYSKRDRPLRSRQSCLPQEALPRAGLHPQGRSLARPQDRRPSTDRRRIISKTTSALPLPATSFAARKSAITSAGGSKRTRQFQPLRRTRPATVEVRGWASHGVELDSIRPDLRRGRRDPGDLFIRIGHAREQKDFQPGCPRTLSETRSILPASCRRTTPQPARLTLRKVSSCRPRRATAIRDPQSRDWPSARPRATAGCRS